jgi:hypothetical protein
MPAAAALEPCRCLGSPTPEHPPCAPTPGSSSRTAHQLLSTLAASPSPSAAAS